MAGLAVSISRLWSDGTAAIRARWILRRAARVGSRVRVWGRPRIHTAGTLVVGERVQIFSTVACVELAVDAGARLEIGARSVVNYGTSIAATGAVIIGPGCLLGTHVVILDNAFHHVAPERRLERPAPRPVTIGENVWIGARALVLPGVTIGDDSVIGAGSVVIDDVPAGVLAVGNPARVVRDVRGGRVEPGAPTTRTVPAP